jgi:hypothetical protein
LRPPFTKVLRVAHVPITPYRLGPYKPCTYFFRENNGGGQDIYKGNCGSKFEVSIFRVNFEGKRGNFRIISICRSFSKNFGQLHFFPARSRAFKRTFVSNVILGINAFRAKLGSERLSHQIWKIYRQKRPIEGSVFFGDKLQSFQHDREMTKRDDIQRWKCIPWCPFFCLLCFICT